MAFVKKNLASGKKQAPMPGPNSPAYKKIVAAAKAKKNRGSNQKKDKPGKKHQSSGAAYGSLKARQAAVERAKRAIWSSMMDINEAIIGLAKMGNFNAAKALFDFAGVYSLPEPEDEQAQAAAAAGVQEPARLAASDPVDAFFRSIGVASPGEPEPAAAGGR